ncbi:putative mediator of RNA polymerase II transcription subunit 26a [Raphanus sativus]|nr:putative mediator of RNA polymerase II transcription subunit 26a [Raphanus sativus]
MHFLEEFDQMTIMKPSASLDTWRDYFLRGDYDIFGIIEHAIMVAATDSPEEFKSRRDTIIKLLFSCQGSNNIGCDELSKADDKETSNDGKTNDEAHEEGEMKLNNSEIVDEVMRIKDILLNRHDEDTEIGKAVNLLRKHGSDKISKRAKTLIQAWKEMVDQWMKMPKEVADADGTPESATLSIVDEAENFPSLPDDLDFYAPEPTAFEISQILDSLDCDGNLLDSVEPKHERRVQSRMMRRPDGTCEANVIGRDKKNQQMRRKEADVMPMRRSTHVLDDPRRQPKQTRGQMVHATQRKPIVVADQKREIAESQQDKHKALDDQEAKFENAKRRLKESYQQHDKG